MDTTAAVISRMLNEGEAVKSAGFGSLILKERRPRRLPESTEGYIGKQAGSSRTLSSMVWQKNRLLM